MRLFGFRGKPVGLAQGFQGFVSLTQFCQSFCQEKEALGAGGVKIHSSLKLFSSLFPVAGAQVRVKDDYDRGVPQSQKYAGRRAWWKNRPHLTEISQQ